MKRLSNIMLAATFISNLFYAMSYPYIYAQTVKVVPQSFIGVEQILCCVGAMLFCWIWNKYSDKLFKYYELLLVAEIIADTVLFADVLIRWDLKFYFLLNVIIYSVITRNLICGGNKMRAKLNPSEKERERFDNNNSILNSASTLIGAGAAIVFNPQLKTLFVLALIGNIADNFFYLYICRGIKKNKCPVTE